MNAGIDSEARNVADSLAVSRGITALVGGGGKTTLLYRLAESLSARGRVIVTTSTHILPPPHLPLLQAPTGEEIRRGLEAQPVICLGNSDGKGKLTATRLSPAALLDFCEYVLVEADGAKGLPLKAPTEHEPVIPQGTGQVIAVAGLDGLGRPIAETVFRPERYAALIGKRPEDTVAPEDVAAVLQHAAGQRKNVLPSMRFSVLLNKADTPLLREQGERVAACLDARLVERAVIASLKGG